MTRIHKMKELLDNENITYTKLKFRFCFEWGCCLAPKMSPLFPSLLLPSWKSLNQASFSFSHLNLWLQMRSKRSKTECCAWAGNKWTVPNRFVASGKWGGTHVKRLVRGWSIAEKRDFSVFSLPNQLLSI